MESSIGFQIADQEIALFICLTTLREISFFIFRKAILINEICSRIIWRINVDYLNLTEVGFSEAFQYLKIVTFDVYIFSFIKANAIRSIRSKC